MSSIINIERHYKNASKNEIDILETRGISVDKLVTKWYNKSSYATDTIVSYNGNIYTNLTGKNNPNLTPETDSTNWVISSTGIIDAVKSDDPELNDTNKIATTVATNTIVDYVKNEIIAGDGLIGTGSIYGGNVTITAVAGDGLITTADEIAHDNTSDVNDLSTNGFETINLITFDEFGHVVNVTKASLSTSDSIDNQDSDVLSTSQASYDSARKTEVETNVGKNTLIKEEFLVDAWKDKPVGYKGFVNEQSLGLPEGSNVYSYTVEKGAVTGNDNYYVWFATRITDGKTYIGFNPDASSINSGYPLWLEPARQEDLDGKEDKIDKGANDGYTPLGNDGKVPSQYLPSTGGSYQGLFGSTSGDVTVSANDGDFYVCEENGYVSTNAGDTFNQNDKAIYNAGTASWDKIENTEQVTTVFTRQGNVVAVYADYNTTLIPFSSYLVVGTTFDVLDDVLIELYTLRASDRIDINDNTSNISTNANDISTNSGNIQTNTDDIGTNANNISTNANDITDNSNDIITNTNDINTNSNNIQDNSDDIANLETNINNGTVQGTDGNALNIRATDEGIIAGDPRGEWSFDGQTQKDNPDEVASGLNSGLVAGKSNKVSAKYGFNGAGQGNVVNGSFSGFNGAGTNNTASGNFSANGSGEQNTVVGKDSFNGAGNNIIITGDFSGNGAGIFNSIFGDNSFNGGGENNEARGHGSFNGTGNGNLAFGDFSFIGAGVSLQATSYCEAIITGADSDTYTANSDTSWNSSDRLFVVGGEDASNNNTLTLFKNGNLYIKGSLFENEASLSDIRFKKNLNKLDDVFGLGYYEYELDNTKVDEFNKLNPNKNLLILNENRTKNNKLLKEQYIAECKPLLVANELAEEQYIAECEPLQVANKLAREQYIAEYKTWQKADETTRGNEPEKPIITEMPESPERIKMPDRPKKEKIKLMPEDGLNFMKHFDESSLNKVYKGFIAQELLENDETKDFVIKDDWGVYRIDYLKFNLWLNFKNSQRMDALENRLNILENK